MKLIISRKGFDTSAGGCPNPIFPDGRMLALPIPDHQSPIKYRDVIFDDIKISALVSQLTKGKVKPSHGAHLDPDLIFSSYPRQTGWRPVLGQTGSAQGHLNIQGVSSGDVFLFFGLFREVEKYQRRWRYVPGTTPKHVLWGWLQIGSVRKADNLSEGELPWLTYHPHSHYQQDAYNTFYLAATELTLNTKADKISGSGVFSHYHQALCLTAIDSRKPSVWTLPKWFYPDKKTPLTYHQKLERWQLKKNACQLQCAARGQEFVLNADEYPQCGEWLRGLIRAHA